jgi:hypothetical protein
LDKVRLKASRHFKIKKNEYLKYRINGLTINIKNNNILYLYTGIYEVQGVYQSRSNVVKDENGVSHNILKEGGGEVKLSPLKGLGGPLGCEMLRIIV